MSLYDRLEAARIHTVDDDTGPLPVVDPPETEDRFAGLRRTIHQRLLESLGPKLYEVSVKPAELRSKVRKTLTEVLEGTDEPLSASDRKRLVSEITDDVLGHGPIEPLLQDPTVTEIMVNGHATVYLERAGKLERAAVRFENDEHLRRTIERIVALVGRRIDESSPYVDARLPDGSRVNAVIPPVALDGPALTIRKFSREPYRAEDLIAFGTVTEQAMGFLDACIRGRLNVLVSGGTGTGKTTTLNVLSSFIPSDERIVTVEDAAELKLLQPHIVRLEHRPPNIEGRGAVTIRDLVRNALRMRPDRIVVGEVRGGESLDMLQAMNTGHDGSISTIHANTPRDALSRLETMVLMAGMDLPLRAIRHQTASAVQLIVHLSRLRDGSRRITHITEVVGMEGDVITLQDLFLFDMSAGVDADGRPRGTLKPTGIRPTFADRLRDRGVPVDAATFEVPAAPLRAPRSAPRKARR